MTDDHEREDIDALLRSPGWQRVKAWAEKDLTAKMNSATEHAANETDDVSALGKLRQVIAAKRAVTLVLDYPETRLQELARTAAGQARDTSFSRRGGL